VCASRETTCEGGRGAGAGAARACCGVMLVCAAGASVAGELVMRERVCVCVCACVVCVCVVHVAPLVDCSLWVCLCTISEHGRHGLSAAEFVGRRAWAACLPPVLRPQTHPWTGGWVSSAVKSSRLPRQTRIGTGGVAAAWLSCECGLSCGAFIGCVPFRVWLQHHQTRSRLSARAAGQLCLQGNALPRLSCSSRSGRSFLAQRIIVIMGRVIVLQHDDLITPGAARRPDSGREHRSRRSGTAAALWWGHVTHWLHFMHGQTSRSSVDAAVGGG
jgi:hypothetical protein